MIRGEEAEWKSCQPVSLVCRIFQPPSHPSSRILLFYQLHRVLLSRLSQRLKLTALRETRPCSPCYPLHKRYVCTLHRDKTARNSRLCIISRWCQKNVLISSPLDLLFIVFTLSFLPSFFYFLLTRDYAKSESGWSDHFIKIEYVITHGLREIFRSNGNKIFESRVLFLEFTIVVKMKLQMFIIHNTRNPKSRIIVTYNDKRGYNPCLLLFANLKQIDQRFNAIVDNRWIRQTILNGHRALFFYIPSSMEFAVNSRVFLSLRKEERKKEIIYLFEIIHLPRQNLLF